MSIFGWPHKKLNSMKNKLLQGMAPPTYLPRDLLELSLLNSPLTLSKESLVGVSSQEIVLPNFVLIYLLIWKATYFVWIFYITCIIVYSSNIFYTLK